MNKTENFYSKFSINKKCNQLALCTDYFQFYFKIFLNKPKKLIK